MPRKNSYEILERFTWMPTLATKWWNVKQEKVTWNIPQYIFYSLHFVDISRYSASVFAKSTTKYEKFTIHFSYFIQISYFVNATKNSQLNPSTFHENVASSTKCSEMQRKKTEIWKKRREIHRFHFSLFTFRDTFHAFSWYAYSRPKAGYTLIAFCRYFTSVFAKHTTKYGTLAIHFLYFIQLSRFLNATKK